MQAEAMHGRYPIDVSGCLVKEDMAYFTEHCRINTEEQLKAIEQAEIYANQPELWYKNQLPLDFEMSRQWCERYRIPYSLKHPAEVIHAVFEEQKAHHVLLEPGV
jgi:hypothetical protein